MDQSRSDQRKAKPGNQQKAPFNDRSSEIGNLHTNGKERTDRNSRGRRCAGQIICSSALQIEQRNGFLWNLEWSLHLDQQQRHWMQLNKMKNQFHLFSMFWFCHRTLSLKFLSSIDRAYFDCHRSLGKETLFKGTTFNEIKGGLGIQ